MVVKLINYCLSLFRSCEVETIFLFYFSLFRKSSLLTDSSSSLSICPIFPHLTSLIITIYISQFPSGSPLGFFSVHLSWFSCPFLSLSHFFTFSSLQPNSSLKAHFLSPQIPEVDVLAVTSLESYFATLRAFLPLFHSNPRLFLPPPSTSTARLEVCGSDCVYVCCICVCVCVRVYHQYRYSSVH